MPPLHTLLAFDAAARNLSFKLAASELNVTQPSISHAIKILERRCRTPLFVRGSRGVRLTGTGKMLFEGVRGGFGQIEECMEAISRAEPKFLTLAISTSLAANWLMPQLPEFHRANPHIRLRLLTTDRDIEPDSAVDMTIWLRSRDWQHPYCAYLSHEVVFPICTPSYLNGHEPISELCNIEGHHLIHYTEIYRERLGWKEWFDRVGSAWEDSPPSTVFNDYQLVVQAVLADRGIGLGWSFNAQLLLREGRLIRPIRDEVSTGNGFFSVANRSYSEDDQLGKLSAWLLRKTVELR